MKKKLRIVFNTWAGAMFQKGGGEVQLLQTKAALENMGHEVLFFDQWNPQIEIDVFHQFSTEVGVEHAIHKYTQLGIPVAISTIMWTPPPKDNYFYYRVKSILDLGNVLMTNSEMESKLLSKYFDIPSEKFLSTRNSISESYFSKSTPEFFKSRFGIDGKFVLSVANIDRRKNTKLLVQACKELGVKLVTIGHVKDVPYYDEFKDCYIDHHHLGPIEDEDMLKSAYAACEVYALPSLCETPGIAALEAASQGAKIVITSEGSTKEYFGEDAIYVNPDDLDSIKNGIKNGLELNKDLTLPKRITKKYRWNITAQEILSGYEKIIRR